MSLLFLHRIEQDESCPPTFESIVEMQNSSKEKNPQSAVSALCKSTQVKKILDTRPTGYVIGSHVKKSLVPNLLSHSSSLNFDSLSTSFNVKIHILHMQPPRSYVGFSTFQIMSYKQQFVQCVSLKRSMVCQVQGTFIMDQGTIYPKRPFIREHNIWDGLCSWRNKERERESCSVRAPFLSLPTSLSLSLSLSFSVQFHLSLSSVEVVDGVRAPRDKVANWPETLKGELEDKKCCEVS